MILSALEVGASNTITKVKNAPFMGIAKVMDTSTTLKRKKLSLNICTTISTKLS